MTLRATGSMRLAGMTFPGKAVRTKPVPLGRIVDDDELAVCVAQIAEITRELHRIGRRTRERDPLDEAHELDVAEEERAVAPVVDLGEDERPAHGSAELIEPE